VYITGNRLKLRRNQLTPGDEAIVEAGSVWEAYLDGRLAAQRHKVRSQGFTVFETHRVHHRTGDDMAATIEISTAFRRFTDGTPKPIAMPQRLPRH
jgi:hypothetical protein